MTKYLVDSNFFIQAHRAYYPLDVATSFWETVKSLAEKGHIFVIDKVKKEIFDKASHEDELKIWCQDNLPESCYISTEDSLENYQEIVKWVAGNGQFKPRAIQEFLETDLADPWLVAEAKLGGYTIVTYEQSAPDSQKKVKIPEVCNQFNVKYVNTIGMMRELGGTF